MLKTLIQYCQCIIKWIISDNCSKTSGSVQQYDKDEPFINNDGVIIDVPDNLHNPSFKSKQKITSQTGNNEAKDVQIMVPLKYLINFKNS